MALMRWTLLAALATANLCGCKPEPIHVDVGAPIILVPAAVWSEGEVAAMSDAATTWNLELGTQLSVARTPPPVGVTAIPVEVATPRDEMCGGKALGRVDLLDVKSVRLCPRLGANLLGVVLHELGHVLNIRGHAADPRALMHRSNAAAAHGFLQEDRQMFARANPGFAASSALQILEAYPLGDRPSLARATAVQVSGHDSQLVWPAGRTLRLAQVDPSRRLSVYHSVDTGAAIDAVVALARADGFDVLWASDGKLKRLGVELPSRAVSSALTLDAPLLPSSTMLWDVSAARVNDDLFVAVTAERKSKVSYHRFDALSGARRPFIYAPALSRATSDTPAGTQAAFRAWPKLVAVDGELLAVESINVPLPGQDHGLVVRRLSLEGAPGESLQLSAKPTYVTDPRSWQMPADLTLDVLAVEGGLVVAHRRWTEDNAIHLYRVRTGDRLALTGRSQLCLRGGGWELEGDYRHVALADTADAIIIAATEARLVAARDNSLVIDVAVAAVDPESLRSARGWQTISVPDALWSYDPAIVVRASDYAMFWSDQYPDHGELRGRWASATSATR